MIRYDIFFKVIVPLGYTHTINYFSQFRVYLQDKCNLFKKIKRQKTVFSNLTKIRWAKSKVITNKYCYNIL
jgi:hypothetical protein